MAKIRVTVWKKPYDGVEEDINAIMKEFVANLQAVGLRAKHEPIPPYEFQGRSKGRVVCKMSDVDEMGAAMRAVMAVAERHGVHFTETKLDRYGPDSMKAAKCYNGPVITADLYRKGCTL